MKLMGFRMIKALKEYKLKKILYATINKDKNGYLIRGHYNISYWDV